MLHKQLKNRTIVILVQNKFYDDKKRDALFYLEEGDALFY